MRIDERKVFIFHEKELVYLLDRLGLLEEFRKGELRCICCNTIINKENFGGIFKTDNEVRIICDKLDCLDKVSLRGFNV